ncbi:MAG: hypothetical protein RIQ81_2636 [Pseudomonadota bacterium]|jgi:hypothetical protein
MRRKRTLDQFPRLLAAMFFSLTLHMQVSACSVGEQRTNGSLSSNLEKEFPVRLEATTNPELTWIWIAPENQQGEFVVCSGGECGREGVTVTQFEKMNQDESRTYFRSKYPVEVSEKRELAIALVDGSWDPANLSSVKFRILRKIKIRSTNPGNLPILEEGKAGDFNLTLQEVFNQGASNWCWGYSAFHAMKTFFNHLPPTTDQDVESYRESVNSVKTTKDLRALMGRHADQWQSGSPFQFLNLLRRDRSLPDKMGWRNLKGSRDEVMVQLEKNLRKGVPAAYCYESHCVTIYGFHTDGSRIQTFTIADSANGRRLKKAFDSVRGDYWAMWSLPDGKIEKFPGTNFPFGSAYSEAVDPYEVAQ